MGGKIRDAISPGHTLSLISGDSTRKSVVNGHFIVVYYQQINRKADFRKIRYKSSA